MDLEHILVTVTGESYEISSIQISAYLAKKYGVSVTLLHVLKNEEMKQTSEDKLRRSLNLLKGFNIDYKIVYKVSSDISQAIIESYNEGHYQLIIMASKRKSGLYDRLFVKSISKIVVNAVDCTVLQIHPRKYGAKNPEIGDLFVLMDGTSRDEYILRWAQLISSAGIPSKVRGYHVMELPGIFPLDEAIKIPTVTRSSMIFDDYLIKLGKRYNIAIKPVFMVGHSFVKAMKGQVEKHEPDAIIIGHSKDKGLRNRIRSVKSYKLMKQVSSAVIVHHMPELNKAKEKLQK